MIQAVRRIHWTCDQYDALCRVRRYHVKSSGTLLHDLTLARPIASERSVDHRPSRSATAYCPKQLHVLRRMKQREGQPNPLWVELAPGVGLFYSPIFNKFSDTPPRLRGGILVGDPHHTTTMMVASLARRSGETAPTLVVTRAHLIDRWTTCVRARCPTLRTYVSHGPHRGRDSSAVRAYQLVITSYETLVRDRAFLREVAWGRVVLDQAHVLRGSVRKAEACLDLNADIRWCLSDTPIDVDYHDLRPLFRFMRCRVTRDWDFNTTDHFPLRLSGRFLWLLHHLLIRVAPPVPAWSAKRETIRIRFTPAEQVGYDRLVTAGGSIAELRRYTSSGNLPPRVTTLIEEWDKPDLTYMTSHECAICIDAYDRTNTSRTPCGHYFCTPCLDTHLSSKRRRDCPMCRSPVCPEDIVTLRPSRSATTFTKFRYIEEFILECESGTSIVVCSPYTDTLTHLEAHLCLRGIHPSKVVPRMTKLQRASAVRRFQGGDAKLLLINPRTRTLAGLSLAADVVILFDQGAAAELFLNSMCRVGRVLQYIVDGTIDDR